MANVLRTIDTNVEHWYDNMNTARQQILKRWDMGAAWRQAKL